MKSNPTTEYTSLLHNEQPSHSIPDAHAISKTQVIPRSPLFVCCCCTDKLDLTVTEYSKYTELKTQCTVAYDKDSEAHTTELNKLFDTAYTIYNKAHSTESESDFTYKTLGFQTAANPHTDFRNGGFISLLIMSHYVNAHEDEFKETFQFKYFAFAITCINVVNDVKTFLRLITNDEIRQIEEHKVSNTVMCNRRQIKCFLRALTENDALFYDVVCIALTQVIKAFKRNYSEHKKEQNYLMINELIKQSVRNISDALLTCSTADELITSLKKK